MFFRLTPEEILTGVSINKPPNYTRPVGKVLLLVSVNEHIHYDLAIPCDGIGYFLFTLSSKDWPVPTYSVSIRLGVSDSFSTWKRLPTKNFLSYRELEVP